jgi:hypothetical protein
VIDLGKFSSSLTVGAFRKRRRRTRVASTALIFGIGRLWLPSAQDDLIWSIAKVTSNIIVVVMTNGPVLMPWKE